MVDWMMTRLDVFIKYHNTGDRHESFITQKYGKIPPEVMPPVKHLFTRKYYYNGAYDLDLNDQDQKTAFPLDAMFSENADGPWFPFVAME
jgi:hypothetical protein